jgi:hypothetical protein
VESIGNKPHGRVKKRQQDNVKNADIKGIGLKM